MSWNSRIANALRPIGVAMRLRSPIVCIAIAVDDSASASPATSAAFHGMPERRGRRRPARRPTARAAARRRRTPRRASPTAAWFRARARSRTASARRRTRRSAGSIRRPRRSPAPTARSRRRRSGSPAPSPAPASWRAARRAPPPQVDAARRSSWRGLRRRRRRRLAPRRESARDSAAACCASRASSMPSRAVDDVRRLPVHPAKARGLLDHRHVSRRTDARACPDGVYVASSPPVVGTHRQCLPASAAPPSPYAQPNASTLSNQCLSSAGHAVPVDRMHARRRAAPRRAPAARRPRRCRSPDRDRRASARRRRAARESHRRAPVRARPPRIRMRVDHADQAAPLASPPSVQPTLIVRPDSNDSRTASITSWQRRPSVKFGAGEVRCSMPR